MNDYFTRLLTAVESIADSLEALTATPDSATPPSKDEAPGKGEAPRRRRRTKAEMEAARAAEEAARAAEEDAKAEPPKAEPPKAEPVAAATGKAPAFDYAILKANVIKLATKFGDEGKKNAINLLANFNVTKADQADPEIWPEMNEKFEAAIAALETPEDDEFA